MVSKKLFYQLHCYLIETLNLPNLPLAGRSVLLVGRSRLLVVDFHQLPPVHPMPVYASSLDADQPESYIANDLWRMFIFPELTGVMRQRGDRHFIDLLNKVRVENVDSEVERTLKSRII